MLVPDRGEPTTKIGLLISSCISAFFGSRTVILRLRWLRSSDGLSSHPEAASDPATEIRKSGFEALVDGNGLGSY